MSLLTAFLMIKILLFYFTDGVLVVDIDLRGFHNLISQCFVLEKPLKPDNGQN